MRHNKLLVPSTYIVSMSGGGGEGVNKCLYNTYQFSQQILSYQSSY